MNDYDKLILKGKRVLVGQEVLILTNQVDKLQNKGHPFVITQVHAYGTVNTCHMHVNVLISDELKHIVDEVNSSSGRVSDIRRTGLHSIKLKLKGVLNSLMTSTLLNAKTRK